MRILSEVVEPPNTKGCGDGLNGDLNAYYILKLSIGTAVLSREMQYTSFKV